MEELLQWLIDYAKQKNDYEPEQDKYLIVLLESTADEIAKIKYPFREPKLAYDMALKNLKYEILSAAKLKYDKEGIDGVISFSEGGASRSYESAGIPSSYLRSIIPEAKIV